jgi:hypothetical protein
LQGIGTRASSGSGLKRIFIPASVQVISGDGFSHGKSLESVAFENESKLQRIGAPAFSGNGLTSIFTPASVEIMSDYCSPDCESFESIAFETGSQLHIVAVNVFLYSLCSHPIELPRFGVNSAK